MNIKELIKLCNYAYGQMEELEQFAENLLDEIKRLRRKMENLPSEESDLDLDDIED